MKLLLKLITVLLFHNILVIAQTATLEPTLSLVNVNGIKVPYQNGMPLPAFEKQKTRASIDLSGEWKKLRFSASDNITLSKRDAAGILNLETEAAGRHTSGFNDLAWEKKILPSVENGLTESTAPNGLFPEYYEDGVWYRKTFNVDASNAGKFAKLIFYSVNYVCDVWINGNYIGYHEGGYSPFAFDVSSKLNYGANNTIAVRIDNIAWGTRKDIIPFNVVDWFNWAGIIHDVYIEFSNPISIIRADIVPKDIDGNVEVTFVLNNKNISSSTVNINIKIFEAYINSTNIQSEFALDLAGSELSFSGTNQSSLNLDPNAAAAWKSNLLISNPKLWTMKTPNLYIMKVSVLNGIIVLDEYYTQFGIRTVATSNGKFQLNDRIMFLPGVARHEEHPDFGRSVPKNIIYSDLQTVKSLNALYLRTAHYPNHLYTYLIADRLGIGIMEEIPLWQWDSQDVFDIQNNSRKLHLQMFREMVFRDYNRPSIFMWSNSNECHLDGGGRLVFQNLIKDDFKNNYYDGRLLTQSAAADKPGYADATQTPLDVAGWTMYFGIFYGTSKSYFGPTFTFVNNAKTSFPKKPLIDTEFGYWSSENGSTESEQVNVFTQTFNGFKPHFPYDASANYNANGNLMGITWWCVFDWYQYKAKKNGWQTMGLISMDRKTEKQVAGSLRATYLPYANKDGLIVSLNGDKQNLLPSKNSLEQNYPNPFNPSTNISWKIAVSSYVTLKVYDLLGREIATLVDEFKQAGIYNSAFNINNLSLPSGVYFYTFIA